MTIKEVEALRKVETMKLDTLERIVQLLDELQKSTDEGAVEWVMEKLNDE